MFKQGLNFKIIKNIFFTHTILFFFGVFIFNGCGGGMPAEEQIRSSFTTITAVDGYIKNATVKDNTGLEAIYSSDGKYTFSSSPTYPIILSNGKLEDTNLDFDVNMSIINNGGLVISPITTFLGSSSTLLTKFASLGLNKSLLSEFNVDYIKTNDTNLSKLSQILYVVLKDNNLTDTFKTSLENNNSIDNLNKLFELASYHIDNHTIFSNIKKLRLKSLLDKVKDFNGSATNMETYLEGNKYNLLQLEESNITHNGTTYGTVMSPYTGKIWLDRNLGATEICSQSRANFGNDADYNASQHNCFGDYYQWGRDYDGHQRLSSIAVNTLSTDINTSNVNSNFIYNNVDPKDWVNNNVDNNVDNNGNLRAIKWSKTDGSSICPTGYRVPTEIELRKETYDKGVSNRSDAFTNFLKLPSAGRRNSIGIMENVGSYSYIWLINTDNSSSAYIDFYSGGKAIGSSGRVYGLSVRCIKD